MSLESKYFQFQLGVAELLLPVACWLRHRPSKNFTSISSSVVFFRVIPSDSNIVYFSDNDVHAQGRKQQMANKTVQQGFIAERGVSCSRQARRFNSFGARTNQTEFAFAPGAGTVNKETLSSDWLWRGKCFGVNVDFSLFFRHPIQFCPFHFPISTVASMCTASFFFYSDRTFLSRSAKLCKHKAPFRRLSKKRCT